MTLTGSASQATYMLPYLDDEGCQGCMKPERKTCRQSGLKKVATNMFEDYLIYIFIRLIVSSKDTLITVSLFK